MYRTCQKCKEKKHIGDLYSYTDEKRGMYATEICKDCLKKHVEMYFPGSPIDRKLSEDMER